MHGGGSIGKDQVSVEFTQKLQNYRFPEVCASIEQQKFALQNLLQVAPKELLYPLIGLAFLSPLNEFFRAFHTEPAFLVYLLGRTQTRKSTLAALILSFFGNFTASTLPCTFKDTENATERKCHILKDVLTVIDDFHPVTHYKERQNMDHLAQALTRGYGDRTGKDRMCADTSLRRGFPPRGNAIITGEDFPQIGQSGSARNFILEVKAGDIPTGQVLNQAQQDASDGALAGIMTGYITWLIPRIDELTPCLKAQFTQLRQTAISQGCTGLGRTGDMIAWLQIGLEYFFTYAAAVGILTNEVSQAEQQESWKILCDLVSSQTARAEEDKPCNLFLTAFQELRENESIALQKCVENATIPKSKNMVGYYDDDFYYLQPSTIYQAVVQFYHKQNSSFPLSKAQLFKQLQEENLIETKQTTSQNGFTQQKRICGNKGRYLVLRRSALEE